jgi:CO dehydrogenase/acetyl-CoA synthase beta subunit
MEFQQAVRSLAGLIQDRTKLSESFNNLAGNPREMDLYVEAQELMKEAAQQKAADDRATQAIEGSETADELRDNISDEASPEVRAAAAEKVEELEKAEQDIITEFEKLSDEELKALDFDEMSPMEQSGRVKIIPAAFC